MDFHRRRKLAAMAGPGLLQPTLHLLSELWPFLLSCLFHLILFTLKNRETKLESVAAKLDIFTV